MTSKSKIEKALEKLASIPDDTIDTSDAPEISAEEWPKRRQMGKFYQPIKKAVTRSIVL